jgi:hypothetical protein
VAGEGGVGFNESGRVGGEGAAAFLDYRTSASLTSIVFFWMEASMLVGGDVGETYCV